MYQQFQYFQQYQQRLSALIGEEAAQRLVNGALVLMTLGGNDFVNNYFLTPFSARRRQFSIPAFSQFLISEFRKILSARHESNDRDSDTNMGYISRTELTFVLMLQQLYDLGARRVVVTGTGPLGCVPAELASSRSRNGECAPEPQQAAAIFNPSLVQMLQGLNQELGSDVFVVANAFQMNNDFLSNPRRFGKKKKEEEDLFQL